MHFSFIYRLGYLLAVTGLFGCHSLDKNRLPPLMETYRKTDQLPFGSFIAFKGFQSEFQNYAIQIAEKPFTETWKDLRAISSGYSLYFLVTKNLLLSVKEINAMMEYVKAGNELFISADYFDAKLLEAVYCEVDRHSEIAREVKGDMNDTHVSLYYGKDFKATPYSYYYFPFLDYFSGFDTSITRILGVNEANLPDYIVLFAGKGRLYLHAAPRAFSNYFLLTGTNYRYFEYVTTYLRSDPQYVYWDEYYKNYSSTRRLSPAGSGEESFSSLQVIGRHPALGWAFGIALFGILIFVVFYSKRKQRQIPVQEPVRNTTIDFAETIGRLYLQQKNPANMGGKMITYFYEYLRKKYFIHTLVIDKEFIESLSRKSGVPVTETRELFERIQQIQSGEKITDEALLDLSKRMDHFKKINDGRKPV